MYSKSKATKILLNTSNLILILCMLISFVGCKRNISEQKAVGAWWSVEDQYLSHYKNVCCQRLLFKDDGTYVSVLISIEDNEVLSTEYGTWVIEKGEIVVSTTHLSTTNFPYTATSTYTYDGKNLKNGIWTYEKKD